MDDTATMAAGDSLLREMYSSNEDVSRCHRTLVKLAEQLHGTLVLTGGLAFGRAVEKRPFNDIDLVVTDLAALPLSLGEDFLVSHFHPSRGRGKILLQLVDASHRVRIDVFTPFSPSLMSRVHRAELCGIVCGIVAAEDLTARLLAIVYGVTRGEPVDPKYYDKFNRLFELADLSRVREIWADYRKPHDPHRFDVAVDAVHQTIAQNAGVLRPDVYDQKTGDACAWCFDNGAFPVSPRAKIFELLGYG